jgi:hypothetical protein
MIHAESAAYPQKTSPETLDPRVKREGDTECVTLGIRIVCPA